MRRCLGMLRHRWQRCGSFSNWGAAAADGLTAIFSSRAAGAAVGFTTAPTGGGATTTTGRAGTAPAAGLATTAPAGGREAIAGVVGGGATMGGAERGCGTILRGSGLAGAAAAGFAAIGATTAGATGFAGVTAGGFPAIRGWRASSSSSFFLAWIAFSTSPGLEMCERSILGATGSAPWRVCALPACDAVFASRAKCARTFSASSSSSELECVFPLETPSSGSTSRIARDLTSSSFARSLIRTLLIRLFSVCAVKWPLAIYLDSHGRFGLLSSIKLWQSRVSPAIARCVLLAAFFSLRLGYALSLFHHFGGVFCFGLFGFVFDRLFASHRRLSIV